ncbi:MAG: sugar phosphate isomerase/epimerase family protein [Eubacteriales bacterium]|nr:sugar phosphate isomerase/epimerase family protein [Eubacteriales bacterium]
MYKYSMTQWVSGKEPLEVTAKRLKKSGYDAIELSAEPLQDLEKIRCILEKYSLPCSSLCGIFPKERDLSSSDEEIRRNAINYLKASIDMAAYLGCKTLITVPSAVGLHAPAESMERAWDNSCRSLREAADYADKRGIFLAIEAINRFETFLINDIASAKTFLEEINHPQVKLMIDLFHMNIEERNVEKAVNMAAPYLIHVHLADNTREPVGMGQIDLLHIYRLLQKISYNGYLTMEFMPRVSNPYLAAEKEGAAQIFDSYTQEALVYCKTIEKIIDDHKGQ